MPKMSTSFNDGKVEKFILDPEWDPDESQNIVGWSLAEGLSFYIIFRYLAIRQSNRWTDARYHSPS